MLSEGKGSLNSYFLIQIPFISFSCIMTLANVLNILLNRISKSLCSCLIPDISRNAYNFSSFSTKLVVSFS